MQDIDNSNIQFCSVHRFTALYVLVCGGKWGVQWLANSLISQSGLKSYMQLVADLQKKLKDEGRSIIH